MPRKWDSLGPSTCHSGICELAAEACGSRLDHTHVAGTHGCDAGPAIELVNSVWSRRCGQQLEFVRFKSQVHRWIPGQTGHASPQAKDSEPRRTGANFESFSLRIIPSGWVKPLLQAYNY